MSLLAEAALTEVPADPWPGRFVVTPVAAVTVVHDLHAAEVSRHPSEREAYMHIDGMVQRERRLMAEDFERGGPAAMAEGHEHRLNRVLARRVMGAVRSYGQARHMLAVTS